MSVKSIILGSASAAALLFASNAFAADVPHHRIASVVVARKAPAFSWEGLYAGAQLGYESSYFHEGPDYKGGSNGTGIKDLEDTFGKPTGIVGGLYAGYNIDLGSNIIAGLDGDINLSAVKKDTDVPPATTDKPSTQINRAKEKYNGAVRARLGYNLGRALPYLAGGLSFADWELANKLQTESGKYKNIGKGAPSKTVSGWNLGGGVDYALSDNLVLRADYRYQNLKNPTYSKDGADNKATKAVTKELKNADLRSNSFRVGVAYKF